MTCVIQSIMPSHYLCSVNLSNYGLSHVPKSTLMCFHPQLVSQKIQFICFKSWIIEFCVKIIVKMIKL
jgi:hypothetical protein